MFSYTGLISWVDNRPHSVRSKMHRCTISSIANNKGVFQTSAWELLFGYQSSQVADRIDVHDLVIISKWMPENKQGLRRWEQVGGYGRWIVWHTGSKYHLSVMPTIEFSRSTYCLEDDTVWPVIQDSFAHEHELILSNSSPTKTRLCLRYMTSIWYRRNGLPFH